MNKFDRSIFDRVSSKAQQKFLRQRSVYSILILIICSDWLTEFAIKNPNDQN
uniref:Uncharacterized protein n=1 Tax=Rhizophagus irregularis (strain DAOM 181602 / DAOM 197198 / MUCL 43194) TaxID=747089 RepID=U9TW33_RHIID